MSSEVIYAYYTLLLALHCFLNNIVMFYVHIYIVLKSAHREKNTIMEAY